MIVAVAIAAGSVLALLACSAFQLYFAEEEIREKRLDRRQLLLVVVVLLCVPCVFLPPMLSVFAPTYIFATRFIVMLGGVIPFLVGSWVALRKGPMRISLPLACIVLVVIASFEYWIFWLLLGGTSRW